MSRVGRSRDEGLTSVPYPDKGCCQNSSMGNELPKQGLNSVDVLQPHDAPSQRWALYSTAKYRADLSNTGAISLRIAVTDGQIT